MRWALALALSATFCGQPCVAATTKPATKSKAHSATANKNSGSTRKTTSTRASSTHTVGSRGRGAKGRRAVRVAAGPSIQAHPDTERYQQIQQALAEKGYYKGEVNGEWNPDSVDALKHFQADQKLEPDGKINSWSLINLGLGPKHEGSPVAATAISASSTPSAPPANPAPAQPPN